MIAIAGTVLVLAMTWLGSAAVALSGFAAAVRAGDGAAVLARTDLPALRRSLTEQIVAEALARIAETRQLRPIEKTVASAYGASVADAMLTKLLTADNLTELLRTGQVTAAGAPSLSGPPAVGQLDADLSSLLGRFRFISPVMIGVRLTDTTDPAAAAEIQLHRETLDWRLAGLILPKAVIRHLVSQLPAK